MIIWYKIGLELFLYRQKTKTRWDRSKLTLLLGSTLLFWPFFVRKSDENHDTDDDWSWRLNVLAPTSLLCRLIYKVRGGTTHYTTNGGGVKNAVDDSLLSLFLS